MERGRAALTGARRISWRANREIRFYRYVGIKSRGEASLLAMVIAARTATLRRGPCASGASMNVTDHHATD